MFKFKIEGPDPLRVLTTTKPIIEGLQTLSLNVDSLDLVSKKVVNRLNKGLESSHEGWGTKGDFKSDVQLVFVETAINFCFWNENDKPKWQMEWPPGELASGGWYSLKKCFERAVTNRIPILDVNFLATLDLERVKDIFRDPKGVDIPLVEKRLQNLVEVGSVLKQKYDGQFVNLLDQSGFDAVNLIKLILANFSSFRDISNFQGHEVRFLKRAQICPNDISYLTSEHGKKFTGLDNLTVFADYKIPQMLREFEVLNYSPELADKVDNYVLIPAGSREEIEIRSATIWAMELLRQKLGKYTAAQLDNALWLISQDQTGVRPYHRTYSIYY